MYSFPRINGEHNFTGYNAFFFLPKSAIATIGYAVNGVVSNISYVASPDWFAGYSIQDKLVFKDEPLRNEAGVSFPVSLTGSAPVDKPEYLALFEQLVQDEFIIMLRDNNGRMKILGTLEKGLRFIYKPEGVGYTYTFSGDYSSPAPFFSGTISIDGTVIGQVLTPAGVYIRAAKWIIGTGAPSPSDGLTWDLYIDNQTTNYYSKATGVWVYQGQLVDQALQEFAYQTQALLITGNL